MAHPVHPGSDEITRIFHDAISICFKNASQTVDAASTAIPEELLFSPEAEGAKAEMIRAGSKLWERQYVDGNGGNLSVRIGEKYAVCTPTLCAKGDLTVEDFALVDLDGRQLSGARERTSEILLHLEIYKAQPAAQAVVHCHPPYATAYAVAGIIPQGNLVPEQEVFVGPLALAPYETPGTTEFARTVLPFVDTHNTVLLQNHGIVCWADTVTHAEWYAEVVENYCKIATIASGLKTPTPEIPQEKIEDLLRRKQRMGLPDPRLSGLKPAPDGPVHNRNKAIRPPSATAPRNGGSEAELERLARSFTSQLLSLLKSGALKSGV